MLRREEQAEVLTESVSLGKVREPDGELIGNHREGLPPVPEDVLRSEDLQDAERSPPD
jgi:hypothetical protein